MSTHVCKLAVAALVATTTLSAAAAPMAGIYNRSIFRHIAGFDSADPGTFTFNLQARDAGATSLSGLDVRPATGALHALRRGNDEIVRIELQGGYDTIVIGSASGASHFAFDPVTDTIRLVGTGLNRHMDPTTGVSADDSPLIYVAGDVNAGRSFAGAISYTNQDDDPATGTRLYGLDPSTDSLVLIEPVGGAVTTLVAIGHDVPEFTDFEIVGSEIAFVSQGGVRGLNSIDLRTGSFTFIGDFDVDPVSLNTPFFYGITSLVVPEPSPAWLFGLGLAGLLVLPLKRRPAP